METGDAAMFLHALFDFDMTLVDSSYAIRDTMNLLAQREGLSPVTREQVLSVIGLPIRESWVVLWGRFHEDWLTGYREIFREREFAGIVPFRGTVGLLDELTRRGVGLGVASNRQDPRPVLKATGLDGYFRAVVGTEDVEHPKPAPDMILKGLRDLGGTTDSTLFVGDTLDDMVSAKAASVRAVGLTTGNFAPDELKRAGAWRVVDDIGDILPLFPEEKS